jgi:ATP-dependent DNA helicase RecG
LNIADIQHIISQGESETVEFKRNFNNETIVTLAAFANTNGGSVYIGVDDKREITGVTVSGESVQNWVNEIKNKTAPSIIPDVEVFDIKSRSIVCFSISEFPVKPVAVKGRFYKRVQNSTHLMNANEISLLHLQSLQTSWDAYPYQNAGIDDLDFDKINTFIKRVNAGGRFHLEEDIISSLNKLSLIKKGVPTNAAMLLFSKRNLGYNVHIGRFKTPSLIIDDRVISGSLFEVVDETMRYLMGHIKVAFEITGTKTQRNEIFEYPVPALRELVLNAIIHRDYTSPVDIQIKIFDQSISIFNPGALYGNLTVDDLKTDDYQSNTRNKLIAEAFYLTKDIEKYGSGYIRVRKEIREYPTMSFNYKEMGNGFIIHLKYDEQKISTNVPKDVPKDVPKEKRMEFILELIKANSKITIQQIADKCNVSVKTVKRDIEKLKTGKIIKRQGGRKEGYWELL